MRITTLLISLLVTFQTPLTKTENLNCTPVTQTPDTLGLAGVYSGFIDGTLIVAGGANFPYGLPADGGSKHWSSDVSTYDGVEWTVYPEALPAPLAYGATVELAEGLLCIGGNNAEGTSAEVFLIHKDGSCTSWSPLPQPLSQMAYARLGNHLYLAGGDTDGTAQKVFMRMNLSAPEKGWEELPPWPGAPRAFAVGAIQSDGQDNCFYLFGGRDYSPGSEWNVHTDAWVYNPRLEKWKPVPGHFDTMAGLATPYGTNHILLIGGASPENERYNGVRLFHTVTGTLLDCPLEGLEIPVTSSLVRQGKDFWLISGEIAPGVRTPVILKGTMESRIQPIGWADILVIILYFGILAWMGWFFSRRQKNADDYFKGGGRIPWFIAGLSIFGTALSAITFMAIPAKAYATDWSYMIFNAGIVLVVPLIVGVFIPFFRRLGVTTAYEYLEKRFSPLVRVLCSVAFIVYQIGRMGVVLLLPAIALNVVTGVNIFLCVGLMGIFSLIYTYMGGIEAVAWTDALQVVVLIGAAIAVVITVCTGTEGGFSGVVSTAAADAKFSLGSIRFDLRQATVWTTLIATVFTNITTYGTDQTIVQRYLTTKTEKEARKGVYTNAILSIPSTLLFFFVGTCLYVFFKQHPTELSAAVTNPDAILPWYVNMHIPTGLLGLVIAGIFAAAMSTLSASMNSAATAYVTDIRSKIRPSADENRLPAAKRATLLIGIVGVAFALVMATWDVKSLWDEFSKILGILLGGLGGLFLLGFLSRKANAVGAVCGLTGCIVIQLLVMHLQAVNLLLYSSVGFISCFVIGWIASILSGGNRKDISCLTLRH